MESLLFEMRTLWIKSTETQLFQYFISMTTLPDVTSPWIYLKLAVFMILLYGIYVIQFRPLNRVRKYGELGYVPDSVYSIKETANFVQKCRKVGNIPPPYPNGWFGLMESFNLKKGQAKSINAFGQNLAVFRDHNAAVHVLDAYCPHMGANLGVGGRVIDDCIECPFHAWRFRGEDGKCVHIPYTDKVPATAQVKTWPVQEVSGWICVWHHSEGLDPTWRVPEITELENHSWVYHGRTEHYVNAHIEEISENGADVVHLQQVHGPIMTAGTDLRMMRNKFWTFSTHYWTASWEPSPDPDGHVGLLKLTHDISVFGFHLPMFKVRVSGRQIGPGLVYLEFDCIFGKGVFIQSVIPQGPLLQKVVHNVYGNPWMPTIIAKIYMSGEAIQFERDIMIWNNKQYEARPMFVKSKEDTNISKHRRWYSQFYSSKNPRMFQKEDLSF